MRRMIVVATLFSLIGFVGRGMWDGPAVQAEQGGRGGDVPIGNGDVNADGEIDISDAIYLLDSLFSGGPDVVPIESAPTGPSATGQTTCYDTAGNEIACDSEDYPGQDGFYEAGYPYPGRYVNNMDGTVTDTSTGLMWQRYTADTNGDGEHTGVDQITWSEALQYCDSLEFAGHTDWRLPNVRELQSIVNYGLYGPAVNRAAFVWTESSMFWSSTSHSVGPEFAWTVFFVDGTDMAVDKFVECHVRAVRGGPDVVPIECPPTILPATGQGACYGDEGVAIPCDRSDEYAGQDGFYQAGCPTQGRFIDNGDGTVTDTCTGLMWQKDTGNEGNPLNWTQALWLCVDMEFAGHNDWRLPNARELNSIVDFGRNRPAIYSPFTALSDYYWTSTSNISNTTSAWRVDFASGLYSRDSKSFEFYVRGVRTIQPGE